MNIFLRAVFVLLISSFIITKVDAQIVSGYIPGYEDVGIVNKLQYKSLTDVIYIIPFLSKDVDPSKGVYADKNGNILDGSKEVLFNNVLSNCRANKINLWLSVQETNKPVNFPNIAADKDLREFFAHQCAAFIGNNGLAGFDLDWEDFDAKDGPNLILLLKAMRSALDLETQVTGKPYKISMAVAGFSNDHKPAASATYVDYLNVMAYDGGNGIENTPYKLAVDDLTSWANAGVPYNKMVLGIPFYGKDNGGGTVPYSKINFDPGSEATYEADFDGKYYYNGKFLIAQKVQYVLSKGCAGVVVWELAQDRTTDNSFTLLGAIKAAISQPDLVVQNQQVSPTTVSAGNSITVSCSNKNQGTGIAPASVTSIWLSADPKYDGSPTDTYLGELVIPSLAAGKTGSVVSKSLTLPAGNYKGTWYIMFGADGGGTVSESNESNNQIFLPVTFGASSKPEAPVLSLTAACSGTAPQITLNWTPTATATSYDIYRGGILYKSGITGTQFINTIVSAGQTYSYFVIAKTASGNFTSNSLSATAPDCSQGSTLPGLPVLSVTADCNSTASVNNLSWSATTNTIAYDIFRNNSYVTTISNSTAYQDLSVSTGSSYTYYVRATNGSGGTNCSPQTVTGSNCSILAPPGVPILSVTGACNGTASYFTLNWNNAANATGYDIYKNNIYVTSVTNTTYTDNDIVSHTTYSYYVKATNGAGGTNSLSQGLSSPNCDDIQPGSPALSARTSCDNGTSKIILYWTSVSNAILYNLYRNGEPYKTGLGSGYNFVDNDITPGIDYTYFVQALNNTGSANSNQLTLNAPDCSAYFPGTPTLTAVSTCSGQTSQVILNWTSSANAAYYDVYRNNTLYQSNFVGTQYTDFHAVAGQDYSYYVAAKNGAGSAPSVSQSVSVGQCLVPPIIESFAPVSAIPGTVVTISGENFDNTSSVAFGGVNTPFTVVSPTTIKATIGNGATGDVSVTTPDGTGNLSGFSYVFSLPADNFTIYGVSATCHQIADGSIHISAKNPENYNVQLTSTNGNGQTTFTDNTVINNLLTGSYHVCITIPDQPTFMRCYDLFIDQPPALTSYSVVNQSRKTVTLIMAGGGPYSITLNDQQYSTTDSTITLPLMSGDNLLTVHTDKYCQGTLIQHLLLAEKISPYPDPFRNVLNLNIGDRVVQNIDISIMSVDNSKLVFHQLNHNQNGVIQLDVSTLNGGVYVLKLSLDNVKSTYKIIKK